MDAAVRKLVCERSGGRCEYCRLPASAVPLITFHIEHIIPLQHDGTDDSGNPGFACPWCNRAKGPNLSGRDLETDAIVTLFNPRTQTWDEHFTRDGVLIVGLTPVGRATVRVLAMNRPDVLEIRAALLEEEIL